MADRKAELERKKAKLEELRKEKQRRLKEKEQQEVKYFNFFCYVEI
jgi:dynein intermediate chain